MRQILHIITGVFDDDNEEWKHC